MITPCQPALSLPKGSRLGRLSQRSQDGLLQHVLGDVHLVGVHAHRAGDGADDGGGLLDAVFDVLAFELVFDYGGAVGDRRYAAEHDTAIGPCAVRFGESNGDRNNGEVINLAVLELCPGLLGALRRGWDESKGRPTVCLNRKVSKRISPTGPDRE